MTNEMVNILLDIRKDFIKKKMIPLHIIVSEEEILSAKPKKGFSIEDMDKTLGLIVQNTSDVFITEDPHPAWKNLISSAEKYKVYHFSMKDGDEYIELTMVKKNNGKWRKEGT